MGLELKKKITMSPDSDIPAELCMGDLKIRSKSKANLPLCFEVLCFYQ